MELTAHSYQPTVNVQEATLAGPPQKQKRPEQVRGIVFYKHNLTALVPLLSSKILRNFREFTSALN